MNIETIDLHFRDTPHAIAAFLVTDSSGEKALVETGPSSTTPALLRALEQRGIQPSEIRHVLLSHIHFDHAGAAGWWARQGATIYVHNRGARHLLDPSRLIASATRIYGDQMETLWGPILPVPENRLVALSDRDTISIGELHFLALDTPGHALHHLVYRLGNIAFGGDAAGIRLPDSGWIDVPAPPPEFHLETWLQTIEQIRSQKFEALYLTHFGCTSEVENQLDGLEAQLRARVDHLADGLAKGHRDQRLVEDHLAWMRAAMQARGIPSEMIDRYWIANPPSMSVSGIVRYLRKYGR